MASPAEISQLYQKYLGRTPYEGEAKQVNYWASLGLSQAEQGIANSDEAKAFASKSGATPAPTTSSDALTPYIERASGVMSPVYKEATDAARNVGETTKKTYDQLAQRQLDREPLVRQTYANLAKELSGSEAREMKVASRIGEQNIGAATAAVASAWGGTAQGSFRAPITKEQNALQASIGEIADKYNMKQETLTSQMNSSLQDLYDKADQYTLQGQTEYSKAMMEVAQLKIQEKKDVLELAKTYFGIDMEVRKLEEQIKSDERQYQLELAKFNFDKAQASSAKANAKGSRTKDDSGGWQFFDAKGNAITPAEYASINGISVAQALQGSTNSGDQAFMKDYNDALSAVGQNLMSEGQAVARLRQAYWWMGNITL